MTETMGKRDASASHIITFDDVSAWLDHHGFDTRRVIECSIRIERPTTYGTDRVVCAWLDVEWFKTTPDGEPYMDGDDVATAHATVPLRSWPPLTPGSDGTLPPGEWSYTPSR